MSKFDNWHPSPYEMDKAEDSDSDGPPPLVCSDSEEEDPPISPFRPSRHKRPQLPRAPPLTEEASHCNRALEILQGMDSPPLEVKYHKPDQQCFVRSLMNMAVHVGTSWPGWRSDTLPIWLGLASKALDILTQFSHHPGIADLIRHRFGSGLHRLAHLA